MKILSVRVPECYLICHGIKEIENRTWQTKYRGKLLIHACGLTEWEYYNYHLPDEILKDYEKFWKNYDIEKKYQVQKVTQKCFDLDILMDKHIQEKNPYFKSQCIIGQVDLIDIVENSKNIWALKKNYHWIIKNSILFKKPIENIKGKLGLWNYDLKNTS